MRRLDIKITGLEDNVCNLIIRKYGEVNIDIFEALVNDEYTDMPDLSGDEFLEFCAIAETHRRKIVAENQAFREDVRARKIACALAKKKAATIAAPVVEKTYGKNLCYVRFESLPEAMQAKIVCDDTGRNNRYSIDEGYRYVTGALNNLCWYLDSSESNI